MASKRRAEFEDGSPEFAQLCHWLDGLDELKLEEVKRICNGKQLALEQERERGDWLRMSGLQDFTGVIQRLKLKATPLDPSRCAGGMSVEAQIGRLDMEFSVHVCGTGRYATESCKLSFWEIGARHKPALVTFLKDYDTAIPALPQGPNNEEQVAHKLQYFSGLSPVSFIENPDLRKLPALRSYENEAPPKCALLLAVVYTLIERNLFTTSKDERSLVVGSLRKLIQSNPFLSRYHIEFGDTTVVVAAAAAAASPPPDNDPPKPGRWISKAALH